MNSLSPAIYLAIFVLGIVFQAGGFYVMTKSSAKRYEGFAELLRQTREDMAYIKGSLSRNGGRKR